MRCPVSIHWDESDPRFLCCEAQRQHVQINNSNVSNNTSLGKI